MAVGPHHHLGAHDLELSGEGQEVGGGNDGHQPLGHCGTNVFRVTLETTERKNVHTKLRANSTKKNLRKHVSYKIACDSRTARPCKANFITGKYF
jgi:hypothetical protein